MNDRIALRRTLVKVSRAVPRDREYLICRVTPGADWWDIDDLVVAVPGRRAMTDAISPHIWHAIPRERLSALESIAERHPNRLRVHTTR
jgi:hypothetical protein